MLYSVELGSRPFRLRVQRYTLFLNPPNVLAIFLDFLDDYPRLMVVFAEFRGAAAFPLLEYAVEIAEVVEATTETNLRDGVRAVDKHTAGISQSHIDDILTEVAPRMEFEETAESRRTHACDISQLRQADLIAIVLVDEILHLLHPAAVARYLHFGKTAGSQRTGPLALGEFIENGKELSEGIETVLDAAQRIKHLIDTHDGFQRKTESLLSLDHHLFHRVEGITRKDTAIAEIDVKLDCHLTDIVALAVVLLPDVLQVWAGDQHEVVLPDDLVGVTHNTTHTSRMLHEVQFVDLVVMYRIGELLLPTVGDVEHILSHQGRYLVNDLAFHYKL